MLFYWQKGSPEVLKKRNTMVRPLLRNNPQIYMESRWEVGKSLSKEDGLGGHFTIPVRLDGNLVIGS